MRLLLHHTAVAPAAAAVAALRHTCCMPCSGHLCASFPALPVSRPTCSCANGIVHACFVLAVAHPVWVGLHVRELKRVTGRQCLIKCAPGSCTCHSKLLSVHCLKDTSTVHMMQDKMPAATTQERPTSDWTWPTPGHHMVPTRTHPVLPLGGSCVHKQSPAATVDHLAKLHTNSACCCFIPGSMR